MNIFGFRPFKGKFNLGNSDDIPENQDGTLIGSIKQIKSDLTDKVTRMSGVSGYQTVDVLGYNPTTKKLGLKVNGADTVIPFSGGLDSITLYNSYSYTWPGNASISFSISGVKLVTLHGNTNVQWDAVFLVDSKIVVCGSNSGKMSGNSVTIKDFSSTINLTLSISGSTLTATLATSSGGFIYAYTYI